MFRQMRRHKQMLSEEACIDILNNGTSGVLAVIGDDDYPYAVPLSYVYYDNKICFHCAESGHKMDAIIKNKKVSFCVIHQDLIKPEKFTTYYRSVIAFGKACILEDESKKRRAIEVLTKRYAPDHMEKGMQEIDKAIKRVCLVEIEIEHLTGKEAMELVQIRTSQD